MPDIAALLLGLVLFCGMAALLLVRLLRRAQLVLHIEVVDGRGAPVKGIPVFAVRNRAGRALGRAGSGRQLGHQLHPVEDSLGVTDSAGRFLGTYRLANYHTLRIGPERIVFVDSLRGSMSAQKPARIDLSHDPLDFTGGSMKKRA